MKEKLNKIVTWICLGLGMLATIFAIVHATGSDPKHVLEAGTMTELGNSYSGLYNIAYLIMVLFMAVALVAIAFFAIKGFVGNIANNPAKAKKTLLVVVAFVVVLAAAFLLAKGDDVSEVLLEKNGLSLGASKFIGSACILCYIIVIGAALSIVYVEVAKLFKKK